MSRQRLRLRLCLLARLARFSVATFVLSSCHKQEVSQPVLISHPNFPPAFDQALNAAQTEVRSHPADPKPLRILAHLYEANRFSKEAKACYETLKATPSGLNPQDHYLLANLALNDGDLDAAQVELREVIQADPHYLPARAALADVLFKSGQSEDAAKEYAAILALDANHLQAAIGLARIELQRGETEPAVARLERTLAAHPETTLGADLLAHELSRRGETERATALTKGSRDKHEPVPPDPWMDTLLSDSFDGQALALRCEDYIMAGQIELAAPLLERVEMLDPKSWIPHVLKGWYEGRARRFTEGILEYSKALEVGADPDKICPLIIGLMMESGKLADAAELARAFFAKQPDSIPILIAYSDVAVRQGDEKTARVLLQQLLEKEPYLYAQNMNYAKILWATGEKDAALVCLQRVAKVYPKDVASRGLIAEYYLGKAEPQSAIPPLEQALPYVAANTPAQTRMQGMLALAYTQQADPLVQSGQFAEAASLFEKAAKLNPTDLATQAALANCYVQLKQFKNAAASLELMSSQDPNNPTILLSLGDVRYQDGAVDLARNRWKQALNLVAPGDTELRQALAARLSGQITAETFK